MLAAPTPLELEPHRPHLLRFALLQLRDRSAAEDAVQDTLLAAIQGASQFAGQSSVRTWLIGILKHRSSTACARPRANSRSRGPRTRIRGTSMRSLPTTVISFRRPSNGRIRN